MHETTMHIQKSRDKTIVGGGKGVEVMVMLLLNSIPPFFSSDDSDGPDIVSESKGSRSRPLQTIE